MKKLELYEANGIINYFLFTIFIFDEPKFYNIIKLIINILFTLNITFPILILCLMGFPFLNHQYFSTFDKSNPLKDEDPKIIPYKLVKLCVLKFDKFKSLNDEDLRYRRICRTDALSPRTYNSYQ